jgi:hypothetical protein
MKIDQTVFFLFKDKIRTGEVKTIKTIEDNYGIKKDIELYKNPAGDQWSCWFSETEIFNSKEDLLKSL